MTKLHFEQGNHFFQTLLLTFLFTLGSLITNLTDKVNRKNML